MIWTLLAVVALVWLSGWVCVGIARKRRWRQAVFHFVPQIGPSYRSDLVVRYEALFRETLGYARKRNGLYDVHIQLIMIGARAFGTRPHDVRLSTTSLLSDLAALPKFATGLNWELRRFCGWCENQKGRVSCSDEVVASLSLIFASAALASPYDPVRLRSQVRDAAVALGLPEAAQSWMHILVNAASLSVNDLTSRAGSLGGRRAWSERITSSVRPLAPSVAADSALIADLAALSMDEILVHEQQSSRSGARLGLTLHARFGANVVALTQALESHEVETVAALWALMLGYLRAPQEDLGVERFSCPEMAVLTQTWSEKLAYWAECKPRK